jgi:hypothetical protein
MELNVSSSPATILESWICGTETLLELNRSYDVVPFQRDQSEQSLNYQTLP